MNNIFFFLLINCYEIAYFLPVTKNGRVFFCLYKGQLKFVLAAQDYQ